MRIVFFASVFTNESVDFTLESGSERQGPPVEDMVFTPGLVSKKLRNLERSYIGPKAIEYHNIP